MTREQAEALLPELVVVNDKLRKSKDRSATIQRIVTAIDWEAVDNAGNNFEAVVNAVRAGVKRMQG
jgi:hypothetical protein